MVNYTFDPESIGVGVLAGWASAYGVYRARHLMGNIRDAVTSQASNAQEFATRGADKRYLEDLVKECERGHLAGTYIKLSEIAIEPRFIPAPPMVEPDDDDLVHSVFHVVPFTPDHPYLQAPYNIETFSIDNLSNGGRAIALLGLPGSGRTTALRIIALSSLGIIKYEETIDTVQQQINASIEELPKDDRNKRLAEFEQIAERARENLSGNRDDDVDESTSKRNKQVNIPLFNRLTPFYLHLSNVDFSEQTFDQSLDPAEPLFRGLQQHVSRITARNLALNFYERLTEGQALLLIDGFDELPERDLPLARSWLKALIEQYSHNFIIVTGSSVGYKPLADAGLSPVFLRSWSDVTIGKSVETWSESWSKISKNGASPTLDVIENVSRSSRALSPFDLTLKMWSQFNDPQSDYEVWIRSFIEKHLPKKESFGAILPKLTQMASSQLNLGYITSSQLEGLDDVRATSTGLTRIVSPSAEDDLDELFEDDNDTSDDELDALFGEADSTNPDDERDELFDEDEASTPVDVEQSPKDLDSKALREQDKWLRTLEKSGLITQFRSGHYRFIHKRIADYLASLTLSQLDDEELIERSYDSRWQGAFEQATNHMTLEVVAEDRFDAPSDILNNNLLELSRWGANSNLESDWKRRLLQSLGNAFVSPNQFPLARERIAAALIGLRDRSTQVIFKRSLQHPNPNVRKLACLGLGALRDNSSINDLSQLLGDSVPDVQLAAGIALGAIGTDTALEEMVIGLTEGSEQLRQAIAEAFASIPDEGYPILYDAINHEDMMLRRAAAFGLRRIQTTWALVSLYRTSLEDKQWYVRSAAEEAFRTMQVGNTASGVKAYPQTEEIQWLQEWISSQGANAVDEDETAEDILRKALEQGDTETQILSVRSMGQLGLTQFAETIYSMLRHQNAQVRQAAYTALADLQLQLGTPLPTPV